MIVEEMLRVIWKTHPTLRNVEFVDYLFYLFDVLEMRVNLFGVLRHLQALMQTLLRFMWPLGSVLKTVLDTFWGVMKALGASWGALGSSQQRLGSVKNGFWELLRTTILQFCAKVLPSW